MGNAPAATGNFPSVVILEAGAPDNAPVPTEPVLMDQFGQQFVPAVIVTRVGQPVEFRNSEDVAHNVHVFDLDTSLTVVNVATPVMGSSYRFTFEQTGAYGVQCDVHPAMAAFIIATSSPYAVVADQDGTFVLPGVPYGAYTLRVWNVDASRGSQQPVEIEGVQTEVGLLGRR
ncbi:MAG: plastocyanin/azurin family copper-binding protein [Acidobacteriota bacterium]